MKKVDYIIVGLGIAGLAFCEQLWHHGKTFVVFDPGIAGATQVAGGVVNPVVLKRFTPVWNLNEFLPNAFPFYKGISDRLGVSFLQQVSIDRVFNNNQEQNDWLVASDSMKLRPFLSSEVQKNTNQYVKAPFGLGRVHQSFQIDTSLLLSEYRAWLESEALIHSEAFDYDSMNTEEDQIQYKNYMATNIVFSEGAAAISNPYFTIAQLIPKKGEYIIVKAPQLALKSILKGSCFVIPLGNDLYKVGATFAHGDFSPEITQKGREQLMNTLSKIIELPFEWQSQMVGMRPTVKDRRPLLGALHEKNVLFFNGLGTRGLMMAPTLAQHLFAYSEKGVALPKEIDIARYA